MFFVSRAGVVTVASADALTREIGRIERAIARVRGEIPFPKNDGRLRALAAVRETAERDLEVARAAAQL